MNIQVYGANKCFDTKKTERYFKERNIKYQSIDLIRYGLSKGEFASVKASLGLNTMINTESKEYQRLNLQYISGASTREEIVFKNPKVYKTPIVRNGKQATVGYQPEIWKNWGNE